MGAENQERGTWAQRIRVVGEENQGYGRIESGFWVRRVRDMGAWNQGWKVWGHWS